MHLFRLVTFCVQYFVIILEFILAFFPEPKSQLHQHIDRTREVTFIPISPISLAHQIWCLLMLQRDPSPCETATFLSLLTWWWQNEQIWRGWRHPLKHMDLPDLNQNDKSRCVAPRFQKNWDKELRRVGSVLNLSFVYGGGGGGGGG